MSYVDALYDRNQDRIHIVERVGGERVKSFKKNYVLTLTSVFGNRISILYSDVWKSTTLVPPRLNYKRHFSTLRLTLTR